MNRSKNNLQEVLRRAITLHEAGKLADAEKLYRQILVRAPKHFDALHLLGVLSYAQGKLDEASSLIEKALRIRPGSPEAHSNRGLIFQARGAYEEASACYKKALSLKPDYPEALSNYGDALRALDRLDEALMSYDKALAIGPRHPDVLAKRSSALVVLGRDGEALASAEEALTLRPHFAEALASRGDALKGLDRIEEALESYEKALAIKPSYGEVLNNRGNLLHATNHHAEAMASFDRALAAKPDYAEAHVNQSFLRRLTGDFEQGWAQYEWRWKRKASADSRTFAAPLWLGKEDLSEKSILLHAEQGFGDTIQFCRYAALLADEGATVILEVQPSLKGLLLGLQGARAVIAHGEPRPPYEYHCPLLSLPLALGTRVDTIPAVVPYLTASVERRAVWRNRVGPGAPPLVGIAWSGNSAHKNDRNRSISISEIAPLRSRGYQLVSLQKEVRPFDQAELARGDILLFGDQLEDFSDTAALISLMDVVVTVDTSVAHLAGAMGKAVWILLPFSPDWRWLLDREDSPWYPTARLFRQPRRGDWESIVREIAAKLDRMFKADLG